ncbi:MAG TPA: enoyl-CoA hydratase/isomerase [Caulobacteraceae bacterium]|nr:enoyl-CoA hydratase/isomerase [Caulobacteraceae bacterium]
MAYEKILLEVADEVATVTLNDPATMNAAGIDTVIELAEAFGKIAQGHEGARAVVLTGAGRGFCSGANLSGGGSAALQAREGSGGSASGSAGSSLEKHYNPFITLIRDFPMPIVTAVNGAAAGVGCSLALMGDLIVAGESAYFLQAFRRIGLVPDGGSTYLLPRMIGRARAMEMALLGERIGAAKALEWGLVNRVVADGELQAAARGLAQELARGPASLGLIRNIMWRSLDADFAQQLADEAKTQDVAGRTSDFGEGVRAFLEKRAAQFAGR